MTKSNHSNTLPIVAATISRFIEGGFGSAELVIVSAVRPGRPGVIVVAFIHLPALSAILPRGSSRHPRFPGVAGSLAHSRDRGKDKSGNTPVAGLHRQALAALREAGEWAAQVLAFLQGYRAGRLRRALVIRSVGRISTAQSADAGG